MAGIQVGANWTVAVILMIIAWLLGASILPAALPHQPTALYWTVAVAGAVLYLASLLAHELSHAVVARRHGVKVRSITLWMLARIAPGDRTGLRLDAVALPIPPLYLAAPEDPAGPLLARRPLGGQVVAVVLAEGRVAGLVTTTDLRQAARRSRLVPADA